MAYLYTIRLEKLEFYAYHGVHACEKELGNRFQIDIAVTLTTKEPIKTLSETVDYAQIANLVHQVITSDSVDLLETLANSILYGIHSYFSFLPLRKIQIKISKFTPPIGYLCEKSSVELVKEY